MEYGKAKTAPNELEVAKMIGIDIGAMVDLESIVVLSGILEQTITGVEDFMG